RDGSRDSRRRAGARPVPARSGGELPAERATRVAQILPLLDERVFERAVRAARGWRRPAARMGSGVGGTPVPFSVGIRSSARSPCATSGEAVSQRGEGPAPDGVPGGGVAGGGGGGGPRRRRPPTSILTSPASGSRRQNDRRPRQLCVEHVGIEV